MRALLVIDAQYDFMPGGSLAVPGGDLIIPVINSIRDVFDLVVFTQDWHPADHCSFKDTGGIWPAHCIQDSAGAQLSSELIRKASDIVIHKGVHQDVDSYSGFWDNERKHKTELNNILKEHHIRKVYCSGLALEYCVKFTALDAQESGYSVYIIKDACGGIKHGDINHAYKELLARGVFLTGSHIF